MKCFVTSTASLEAPEVASTSFLGVGGGLPSCGGGRDTVAREVLTKLTHVGSRNDSLKLLTLLTLLKALVR